MSSNKDIERLQIKAIVQFMQDKLDGQYVLKPNLKELPLPTKYEGWKYDAIINDLKKVIIHRERTEAKREVLKRIQSAINDYPEMSAVAIEGILEEELKKLENQ